MAAEAPTTNSIEIVGDISISQENPLQEYKKLMASHVAVDEIVDDDIIKENFIKIATAARDVIWQMVVVGDAAVSDESQRKAAELLEEYKNDACFFDPWPYNDWIGGLRDGVLRRELLEFWRESMVKKQLGPCWSRDSDLFEHDDEPPLEFYAHAGCVAPFAASLKVRAVERAASIEEGTVGGNPEDNAAALSGNFEATISLSDPLKDYRDLMKRYVLTTIIVPDDIHKKNIDKICMATRTTIWKLLFEGTPNQEAFDKAAELLQEYKSDAGFYGPWEYNEWIVKLRDEILQRNLLEFWSEKIVKMELGPCCARDSDYFESSDKLPIEFYNKAGCKAPFSS